MTDEKPPSIYKLRRDGGTPIEVLQLPGELIEVLKKHGFLTVEAAFAVAVGSPEPMEKLVNLHLAAHKKRYANFIAECSLHLSATWLKWLSDFEFEEYSTGLILDD